MPKLLIAVKSCAQDAATGANDAIRETWGKHISVRFFFGRLRVELHYDEHDLDCPDGYYALPLKTRAILNWSLRKSYEFTFLCDTDTFVNPPKLLSCGFEKYDLTGLLSPGPRDGYHAWPSGGAGYFLSAKAAQIIVDHPLTTEWAEDRMVGQILGPFIRDGKITAYDCPGFHVEGGTTLHYCARGMQRDYDPNWMREQYRKNGGT